MFFYVGVGFIILIVDFYKIGNSSFRNSSIDFLFCNERKTEINSAFCSICNEFCFSSCFLFVWRALFSLVTGAYSTESEYDNCASTDDHDNTSLYQLKSSRHS